MEEEEEEEKEEFIAGGNRQGYPILNPKPLPAEWFPGIPQIDA